MDVFTGRRSRIPPESYPGSMDFGGRRHSCAGGRDSVRDSVPTICGSVRDSVPRFGANHLRVGARFGANHPRFGANHLRVGGDSVPTICGSPQTSGVPRFGANHLRVGGDSVPTICGSPQTSGVPSSARHTWRRPRRPSYMAPAPRAIFFLFARNIDPPDDDVRA
jgi:hypothetical protein